MDDFRRKPVNRAGQVRQPNASGAPVSDSIPSPTPEVAPLPKPLNEVAAEVTGEVDAAPQESPLPPKKSRKKWILWAGLSLLAAGLLAVAGAWIWYQTLIAPVDSDNTDKIVVTVQSGTTPTGIAELLQEKKLIRSVDVFMAYTRLSGVQNNLQAGTYRLSPSESLPEIVEHLKKGSTDGFTITFLPGDTLEAHRKVLESAGYKKEEIDQAFSASYDHPLLGSKPVDASLEGYIYGETYRIASGSNVEAILEKTFDQFYSELEESGVLPGLEAKGYTLHEAITFASIIQREEKSAENQKRVAGVFTNRLEIDMPLQSDPTFIYAARQIGAPETNQVDSLYNTYKYAGLPPGPIASPNVTALEAIVNPEPSEFLYFLSGDDDQLYFARTFEEHERNIQNHCQQKCFSY